MCHCVSACAQNLKLSKELNQKKEKLTKIEGLKKNKKYMKLINYSSCM